MFVPEGWITVIVLKFFNAFCSIEPSPRLLNYSVLKSSFWGFLCMVNGESPLPIQDPKRRQYLPEC